MKGVKYIAQLVLVWGCLQAAQAWAQGPCLDGWKYRVTVIVNNPGAQLTGHQVKFLVNTQDLVLQEKAKADAGDIRVTDNQGTPISFWIKNETYNTPSTTIWAKAPEVNGSGNDTLYLFYGNPTANNTASGIGTFEFFDDFDGNFLEIDNWQQCHPGGAVSISGGEIRLSSANPTNTAAIYSKKTFDEPVWIDVNMVDSETGKTLVGLVDDNEDGWGMLYEKPNVGAANMRLSELSATATSGVCISAGNQTPSANEVASGATTGIWSFAWPESSNTRFIWPGGSETRSDATKAAAFANPKKVYLANSTNVSTTTIDYVAVRKYVANQPTLTVQAEAQQIPDNLVADNTGPYCEGESILLSAPVIQDASYQWTGPGIEFGTVFTREVSIANSNSSKAGTYNLVVGITGGCQAQTVSTSVLVSPASNAGNITPNQTVCGESNQGTVGVSGFTGSILKWQSATDASGPWITLESTSASISFSNLQQNTFYRAIVQSGVCDPDTSGIAMVTVNSATQSGIILGAEPGCEGFNTGELTLTSFSGAIQRWESSANDGLTWTTINNTTNKQLYEGLDETTLYRAQVKSGACPLKPSEIATVTVHQNPTVAFSAADVCLGAATQFEDESNTTAGSIYRWNFGDGTGATVNSPIHEFAQEGTYNVQLKVTNNQGCIDSVANVVKVNPRPSAAFSFSTVCEGIATTFRDESSISTGQITRYDWDLGSGVTDNRFQFQNQFPSDGVYPVLLKVTSAVGCVDSITQNVAVNFLPKPNFTAVDVCVNIPMPFENITAEGASEISYQWFFGDGADSQEKNPLYTYDISGEYSVILQAQTAEGCTNDTSITVNVFEKPVASFTTENVCIYDTAFFINTSTPDDGTVQFEWDFGNGDGATGKDQKYKYSTPGVYRVEMLATSGLGCKSLTNQQVTILDKPIADFTASAVCLGDAVTPVNLSSDFSGATLAYQWIFESAGSSTDKNPTVNFDSDGTYTATLVANNGNCVDTASREIVIHPLPQTAFTATDVCEGQVTLFDNGTRITTGTITQYTWAFGNGNLSNEVSPVYQYIQGVGCMG